MQYFGMHLLLLLLICPSTLVCSLSLLQEVSIISIVDYSSTLSTVVKLHSIIKSTKSPSRLHFKFLLVNEKRSIHLEDWNTVISTSFPDVKFESKLWTNPITFPKLKDSRFEKTHIYARFYLPHIFPNVSKYIYLDNDLIVTGDICELFDLPLVVSTFRHMNERPVNPHAQGISRQEMLNNVGSGGIRGRRPPVSASQEAQDDRVIELSHEMIRKPPPPATFRPVVGFVYERHTDYNKYLQYHFNSTHPLVLRARQKVLSSLFLNGGVALVDAGLWRQRNITAQVEERVRLNQQTFIFDSTASDQGVFYLLFHHEVGFLPARWNMRRLPMKTVHMLQDGVTGERGCICIDVCDVCCMCRDRSLRRDLTRGRAVLLPLPRALSHIHPQCHPTVPQHRR